MAVSTTGRESWLSRATTESVVTEGLQTHHFSVTSRNDIYCSDAPNHKIWLVDNAGHKRVVYDGINWPRGIRASADGSTLVVNDPPTRWVWLFKIQADGSLINGRTFYHLETAARSSETDAGGMVFDSEGSLYVATKIGVQVFDERGRLMAILDSPSSEGLSNVWFGGPGLQWLYVTDGDKVYRRPVKRHGAGL
jgi:sugar lactone lactonase YvrE